MITSGGCRKQKMHWRRPNLNGIPFAMARHPTRDNEQYSDDEAQRRFMTAVKAGLNTKPIPLKSIVPKGVPAQSKKRRKQSESGSKEA
jgi:hypothetical protein